MTETFNGLVLENRSEICLLKEKGNTTDMTLGNL